MTQLLSSLGKLPLCALNTGVDETSAIHQAGVIAVAGLDVRALQLLCLNKMIC